MATGIEAAGLVLGSIPLILASLQFYAEGIAVTKRFWKYKEEINILLYELGVENTMYINSINILLFGVVSQKEMPEFLLEPAGTRWKDQDFDRKLRARLGTSFDSYMDSIGRMIAVVDQLKERLRLNSAGRPQFRELGAFKEQYKRLKFSLKKSDYNDLMEKLRRANQSLHRLTTQTDYLERLQASSRNDQHYVPNYRVINDRADSFHSTLKTGWNCPCQANHSVSLRLEARIDDDSSEDDDEDNVNMRDPFHVIFCYDHGQHFASLSGAIQQPAWTWEEADVRVEQAPVTSPADMCAIKANKGVRFAQQNMKQAVKAALEPQADMQPIQNLCAAISALGKPQRDVCFSLLTKEIVKQKYGIHIYPVRQLPADTDTWSITSLRSVLNDTNFARRERLKLAVTLASSVLQLHETPWLEENWGKDSIFFVKRPDKTLYDQPFVSQQFAHVAVSTPAVLAPNAMSRVIRNQTLYALGVALIELWYGKTLSELRKDADGPSSTGIPQMDSMTEWNTADRLVDELYCEAGGKYGDAVRRCIRCDFDRRASSLEDIQFQKDVFQGVVAELKLNYEFMFQHT